MLVPWVHYNYVEHTSMDDFGGCTCTQSQIWVIRSHLINPLKLGPQCGQSQHRALSTRAPIPSLAWRLGHSNPQRLSMLNLFWLLFQNHSMLLIFLTTKNLGRISALRHSHFFVQIGLLPNSPETPENEAVYGRLLDKLDTSSLDI